MLIGGRYSEVVVGASLTGLKIYIPVVLKLAVFEPHSLKQGWPDFFTRGPNLKDKR